MLELRVVTLIIVFFPVVLTVRKQIWGDCLKTSKRGVNN